MNIQLKKRVRSKEIQRDSYSWDRDLVFWSNLLDLGFTCEDLDSAQIFDRYIGVIEMIY